MAFKKVNPIEILLSLFGKPDYDKLDTEFKIPQVAILVANFTVDLICNLTNDKVKLINTWMNKTNADLIFKKTLLFLDHEIDAFDISLKILDRAIGVDEIP